MKSREFPGCYSTLVEVAAFIRGEAEKCGLGNKETFELETAVDEAVSNIIEHAYGGENLGVFSCRCTCLPDGIEVTLEDHGTAFDPSCVPIPNLRAALKDRKNHGLGFYMMNHLVDQIHFDFTESKNQLVLVKKKKNN